MNISRQYRVSIAAQFSYCLILSGLLLLTVSSSGCNRGSDHPSAKSATDSAYFKTQFQDEPQFIVESIVSDLAGQVYYGKNKKCPDPKYFSVKAIELPSSSNGAPTYQLQVTFSEQSQLEIPLEINGPIWSPDVYRDVVAALAQEVSLPPAINSNPSDDTDILLALGDGSATTLEKKSQKLSKSLEDDFLNSLLHEKAAMLIGAFALRESSGEFFEIRTHLCRMTAHLAMARYLKNNTPLSVHGEIGSVMLSSLMNNQSVALEQLHRIKTVGPGVKVWTRALEAYNTYDYRPLADSESLSRIERIAWFRAFAQSVDVDDAWQKLSNADKVTPDFAWIANAKDYSVGTGHELLRVSLASTLQEINAVHELSQGRKLDLQELANVLNTLPQPCVFKDGDTTKVEVIGWGQWAMFFQRQLCHTIRQNFHFLNNKWGVPDEAKSFSTQCDQLFGALRLYPFVRRFNCTDENSYHLAVDDSMKVTVATPQLTPAECWNYLCYRVSFAPLYQPNPNPHINEWHKYNPLPGTAYNPLPRFNHPSLVSRTDVISQVQAMHTLAPYDRIISFNLIRLELGGSPTYEQAKETYKAVLPYDSFAMYTVASTIENQPVIYEELMSRAAELDPDRYYDLGDYFIQIRDEERALKYYEKGSEFCSDSVRRANHASWLVACYLKKSELDKAKKAADEAGEVYSSAGLRAKAEFLEATGDYTGAMEWYLKIYERYKDAGPAVGFSIRCKAKTGDDQFAPKTQKIIAEVFPKGIEAATLNDFTSAPVDGVLIAEENNLIRQAGLKRGDVIVSVFGIRVHNFEQYSVGRSTDPNPEMPLIVWQNGGYKEFKVSPPNHKFGVLFTDYQSEP